MLRTRSFTQVDGDELVQPLGPLRYELLEEDAPEWVAEPCQVPARVGHAACHARLQVKLLRTRSVRAACASTGFWRIVLLLNLSKVLVMTLACEN